MKGGLWGKVGREGSGRWVPSARGDWRDLASLGSALNEVPEEVLRGTGDL